ncbi:MAG: hypothetical protein JWQ95_5060 [Sphaerisporangium sp.]|jgi:hypothetical protein|nr:hypothetical protein [Sphaerisporangium sp.]
MIHGHHINNVTNDVVRAQAHALRILADLIDRLALPCLYLTVSDDRIGVQITPELGDETARIHAVQTLAAAIGGHTARRNDPGPTHGWMFTDGVRTAAPSVTTCSTPMIRSSHISPMYSTPSTPGPPPCPEQSVDAPYVLPERRR